MACTNNMSYKIGQKIKFVAFVAVLAGAEHVDNQTQVMMAASNPQVQLFNRALKAWPQHHTNLENTTLEKSAAGKEAGPLSFGAPPKNQAPTPKPPPPCNTTKHRMQISAEWRLLSCSTAVKGELEHEVTIGITNESEYSQEFERMVKNQFIAGMEFAIGPMVKNKLTGEGTRIFESAFSTSSETETTDVVSCEVFGGTWCMWQWHMTFSQCHEVVDWNSPISQCSRGMDVPPPPKGTEEIKKAEPGAMSALSLTRRDLTSSCLCVLMSLVVAIATYFVASLRPSHIEQSNLQEPLMS